MEMRASDVKSSEEDFIIECSDEELGKSENWEPAPSEIVEMYQILSTKGILELEWICPGRRSPSVHDDEIDSAEKGSLNDDDENKQSELNEFDFDDEVPSQSTTPKITPRRRQTPANSAQRRVASMDKVMFDIERYRKLDELELKKVASPDLSNKTKCQEITEKQET